jgi:hypothetical protein
MYNVTQNFLSVIKQNGRTFKGSVTVNGAAFDDDNIIDIGLDENVNPTESFMLGGVGSSKLEVTLLNVSDLIILENAKVTSIISLLVNGSYEDVPLGVFTTDEVSKDKNKTKLICYDNMILMEKAYFSSLTYPASINAVAQEICTKVGVQLATVLPNIQINKIEGYTYREAVSFIASFLGGFARFNRAGELEIITYIESGFGITSDNYFPGLKTGESQFTIGKLTCKVGDSTLTSGTNGNEIQFENPIMTQAQLDSIFNTLKTMSYMPYSMDYQGNQALQSGDKITFTDLKGNTYNTLVMDNKIVYSGGLKGTVSAVGKTGTGQDFSTSGSIKNTVDRVVIEQANINLLLADKATIEDLTATNGRIDNFVAGTAQIADLAVTSAKIANATITNANIADATIGTAKIALGAITTALIATASIGTSQLADASITDAKIVGMTANKITAGTIDAGVINVTNLHAANITVGTINGTQISSNTIASGNLTTALNSTISTASTNANTAITTANGKNTAYWGSTTPTGTFASGDLWFDTSNGNRVSRWNGSTWTLSQFGNAAVTNLDAASITSGSIAAARIAAGTITGTMIAGTTITASNILANTITASQIAAGTITATQIASRTITADRIVIDSITANEIAAHTITANEIVANTITAAQIASGTITATQMAVGTITAASGIIASIDASKITTGTLSGSFINGGTITGVVITAKDQFNVSSNIWNNGTSYGITFGGIVSGYVGPAYCRYLQGLTGDGSTNLDFTLPAEAMFTIEGGIAINLNSPTLATSLTASGLINANGGISQDGFNILNGTDTWLRTNGSTGWYSTTFGGGMYMVDTTWVRAYNGRGLLAPMMATDRIQGYSGAQQFSFGASYNCRVDSAGGDLRLYTSASGAPDYGIRSIATGQFDFIVNNVSKFSVSSTGAKVGGTFDLDGISYGMSPIDSPRSLIEDVYINILVDELGTTIDLDDLFARMIISQYGVFPSNGKVEVVSKDLTSFTVKGYTGTIDIRVVGIRKDRSDQYFPIMNDMVA